VANTFDPDDEVPVLRADPSRPPLPKFIGEGEYRIPVPEWYNRYYPKGVLEDTWSIEDEEWEPSDPDEDELDDAEEDDPVAQYSPPGACADWPPEAEEEELSELECYLQEWRQRQLTTQKELAEAANVSRSTIASAERGARIAAHTAEQIAGALSATVDDLQHAPEGGE
jgi:DNA-binding XRE family transcriptional regulator